jgi:hypothetical protein
MFTTITTASRPRVRAVLAIVLGLAALAIPATAGASYGTVPDEGQASAAQDNDTGLVIPDHTALNESLAPAGGSLDPGSIDGPAPTPVIDTPAAVDRFDWGDAALGAGMTMALLALAGAGVLALRRHGAVSPSAG